MKKTILIVICFATILINAKTVTFRNQDMMMEVGPAWMFNYHLTHPFNESIHAFTAYPQWVYETLSYNWLSYPYNIDMVPLMTRVSTSRLTGHSYFPPLAAVAVPDTSYKFFYGERYSDEIFRNCAVTHINTLNSDWDWKTMNQAGDTRLYSGGTMYIKKDVWSSPQTLLRLNNCSLTTESPYPAPFGSGEPITGYGWGYLDPVNGDPEWISEWTNSTGQVLFTFSSSSAVVQDNYGYYSSDITLSLPTFKRDLVHAMDVDAPYTLDAIDTHWVSLTVENGDYISSVSNADTRHSNSICKYYSASIGNYPAHIVNHYDGAFWEVGNTFDHSNATIVFDFSDVPGVTLPQNLRVLRRQNGYGVSWVDMNAQLISTNPLRMQVSGYDIMGQYCLASTGGNNLAIDFPQNVSLVRVSNLPQDLRLSWEEVYGASQYKVYSSANPDSPDIDWTLEATLPHPVTEWFSNSADPNRYYHVKAVKAD